MPRTIANFAAELEHQCVSNLNDLEHIRVDLPPGYEDVYKELRSSFYHLMSGARILAKLTAKRG